MVAKLMADETKADRSMLPVTGCSPEWEFVLSSIFIEIDTEQVRNSISTDLISVVIQAFQCCVLSRQYRGDMEPEAWLPY